MKLLNRFINFSGATGALLCSLLICFTVQAQTGTAVIRGAVTDPQGKLVAQDEPTVKFTIPLSGIYYVVVVGEGSHSGQIPYMLSLTSP